MKLFEILIVVSSFLTFGAICVQAYIYNSQLKEMQRASGAATDTAKAAKESADAARHSVELVKNIERAFVVIQNVPVCRISGSHIQTREWITFNLKNFGRTMANSVTVTGKFIGIGRTELDFSDIPNFPGVPTNIAPEGLFRWVVDTEILGGNALCLEYELTVRYVDLFRHPHTYYCRGRHEPTSNEFLITGSSSD